MKITIETLPVGMLAVNCYLVWESVGRKALIIDPGDEAEEIVREIREKALIPTAILLTHAHVDHIRGVRGVAAEFGIPVLVSAEDRKLYLSPDNALMPWLSAAKDLPMPVDSLPPVDGLEYTVIHTPGHTPGGVCYYFADDNILFSGDTLFQGSVGRTDLAGGDAEQLMNSIQTKLLNLPSNTRVYPGHGNVTTIGNERVSNPYLGR